MEDILLSEEEGSTNSRQFRYLQRNKSKLHRLKTSLLECLYQVFKQNCEDNESMNTQKLKLSLLVLFTFVQWISMLSATNDLQYWEEYGQI